MDAAILNTFKKNELQRILCCVLSGIILMTGLLTGCGETSWTKRWQQSADPYHGGSYPAAFSKWRREARIYQGLDLKLIAAVTVKSAQFRQAYVDEYTRIYQLSEKDRDKLLQDQMAASEQYIDMVMAVYVPEKSWNDFALKKSMWQLYLSDPNGRRFIPVEIRKIKDTGEELNHFYPYLTPWKSLYHVRFPADAKSGATVIKLTITGVQGNTEMVWEDFL